MIPLFNNPPLINNNNMIRILHRRQPMSYNNSSPILRNIIKSLLNTSLISPIQSRSSFIKQQNLRILQYSPSNTQPLLLPSTKLTPTRPHISLQLILQPHHKIISISLLQSSNNLLLTSPRLPKLQILFNSSSKKHRFLPHIPYILSKPFQIQILNILPINKQTPLITIIEPFNKLHNSTLPTP